MKWVAHATHFIFIANSMLERAELKYYLIAVEFTRL